jgi:hypothetical protein
MNKSSVCTLQSATFSCILVYKLLSLALSCI